MAMRKERKAKRIKRRRKRKTGKKKEPWNKESEEEINKH